MADRHQFRAKWHDYNCGLYFITICACEKRHLFGRIVGTRFFASALGEIIEDHIKNIPRHYHNDEILNYFVMTNNINFLIYIDVPYTTQSS